MKLFIGWSGDAKDPSETSGKIASILEKWLERMFDGRINIFSDTVTGPGWFYPLKEAMSGADCGLLCVTANNVNLKRLADEADTLRGNGQLLIPLLFDVDASRLGVSLRMLRPIPFGFDGMRELTRTLNDLLGEDALPAEELEQRLQARYPTLGALVQETLAESEPQTPDDWRLKELDDISAQLEKLKTQLDEWKKEEANLREQLSKSEPQTPDEEEIRELGFKALDEISAQLMKWTTQNTELTKRAERLKVKLSTENPPRKDSRVSFGEAGDAQ